MKKYFVYELKKSLFTIGLLTLVAIVVYLVTIVNQSVSHVSASGTCLWAISLFGGILAALVPLWVFNYKMKRRSVDLYFSLPLSHARLLAVKFLIGLIAVFAPYTVAYWVGALFAMVRFPEMLYPVYYLPQYFASLLPVYFIYAISSFAFTRANTRLDGFFFIAAWMFAVTLVVVILNTLTCKVYYDQSLVIQQYLYPAYYLPFAPLDFVTTHFQQHLAQYLNVHVYNYSAAEIANIVVGFTLTTLMAAGATAGLLLAERRVKAEAAGQISNSWFGYRVMIPLYTVLLLGYTRSIGLFATIFYVLLALLSFAMTALYKRTLKIGWKQAIVYAIPLIVGVLLIALMQHA